MHPMQVKPDTMLSAHEELSLADAQAIIANGGPLAPPEPLADWERELLGDAADAMAESITDPAVVVAQARERVRSIKMRQAVRSDTAELLRSTPNGPLDLDAIQDVLMRGVEVSNTGPAAWVEQLLAVTGQTEAGPLRRLAAGVASVGARRDGQTSWKSTSTTVDAPHRHRVEVSASSEGGAFSARSWTLSATFAVREDMYGEVQVQPEGADAALTISSGSDAGDTTTYTGQVVGWMAVRWWMSYKAREGVRAVVSSQAPAIR